MVLRLFLVKVLPAGHGVAVAAGEHGGRRRGRRLSEQAEEKQGCHTREGADARLPGGGPYWTVDFFLPPAPTSTGFAASSFRSYFASEVLRAAALANRALASASALGA